MTLRWELVEHTADLALRVYGRDLPELFLNAALALFEQVDPSAVRDNTPTIGREISIEGDDCESLLVNWMNELLYLHEVHREAYFQFEIQSLRCDPARFERHGRRTWRSRQPGTSPSTLSALARGVPSVHPERLIKAATFHELHIEPSAQGWAVTLVFDI